MNEPKPSKPSKTPITLLDCDFSGNKSGGVYIEGTPATLINVTANNTGGHGFELSGPLYGKGLVAKGNAGFGFRHIGQDVRDVVFQRLALAEEVAPELVARAMWHLPRQLPSRRIAWLQSSRLPLSLQERANALVVLAYTPIGQEFMRQFL